MRGDDREPGGPPRRRAGAHLRAVGVGAVVVLLGGLATVAAMTSVDGGQGDPVPTPTGAAVAPPAGPSTSTTSTGPATTTTSTSGAAPAAGVPAFAVGAEVHVDGRVLHPELDGWVAGLSGLGDGGLMVRADDGESAVALLLDPDGKVEGRYRAGFAVAADGTRVLLADGATATVIDTRGTVLATTPYVGEPVAVVGTKAYLRPPPPDGASSGSSLEWDVETGATRVVPGWVADVTADGTRGVTMSWSLDRDSGAVTHCWGLVDLAADPPESGAQTCAGPDEPGFRPAAFSPDGTHVIGDFSIDAPYLSLAIVRLGDGAVVVGGPSPGDLVPAAGSVIEDGGTFVMARVEDAEATGATGSTLVRCAFDLSCAELAETVPWGADGQDPRGYVLATTRVGVVSFVG